MALAGGNPGFSPEVAAAGNSNVVRAEQKTMSDLGLDEQVDVLLALGTQYHLINVLQNDGEQGLFIYLATCTNW
ncbi:hypothetical protein [Granulicoccus phenolivorans]|uniref:hypothetical protein n=1 Tax=Granulicoccus phenolivorans TaxID=266854 RepID=UPI0003F84812|nr:hypothetical protein [Granulicoccus phenolivorans]